MFEWIQIEKGESFWKQDPPLEDHTFRMVGERDGVYCSVTSPDGTWVSAWNLHPMPFCCGILVSGYVSVDPNYRRRGIGRKLNHWRQKLARHLGFGFLICTDVMGNIPQTRILNQEGWKQMGFFTNPRTGNLVEIRGKELEEV